MFYNCRKIIVLASQDAGPGQEAVRPHDGVAGALPQHVRAPLPRKLRFSALFGRQEGGSQKIGAC